MIHAVTKNKKNEAVLHEVLQKAFGKECSIGDEIIEMDGGFCNAVYQAEVDGSGYIIKIAPPPNVLMMGYEKNMMETEVEMLHLVREQTTVPVPNVVFYDDSCAICDSPYFIMTKVEGETLLAAKEQLSKEEYEHIQQVVGGYNRQINSILGKEFSLPGRKDMRHATLAPFVMELFDLLLEDGKKVESDLQHIDYEEVYEILHKYKWVFEEVKTPQLVHWDLWEGNIFIKEKEVCGIIDFERCIWSDPLMEHEFSGFGPVGESFLSGYEEGKVLTETEAIRSELYRLYRILSSVIECNFRNYGEDWMYRFSCEELKKLLVRVEF